MDLNAAQETSKKGSQTIQWGILGTGNIASQFASGLQSAEGSKLIAVASRSQRRADQFASRFDLPHSYASYAALCADPELDIVYIASPHHLHRDHTLLSLEQGKHVLCEKPLAINAVQAAEMIRLARTRGLFLMEAMWSRFLPALRKVMDLIDQGAIGAVRMLMSDFGFRTQVDLNSRVFDPAMGGGSLLDVGIYPLSLASMLFGRPATIQTIADLGETGIDEQAAVLLGYQDGALAVLASAVRTESPQMAHILGEKGRILIHAPWWFSDTITLIRAGHPDQAYHLPYKGNGYPHEAEAVAESIRAGRTESPIMPLDESLAIMQTMDEIRARWGLRYPME